MLNSLEAACMSYLAYELKRPGFPGSYLPVSNHLCAIFNLPQQLAATPPQPLITKIGKVHHLVRQKWFYYDSTRDGISGYQCIVFINHENKEIVLAHRGTIQDMSLESKANVKSDIEILKGEQVSFTPSLTVLLSDVVSFITRIVRKRTKENPDYKILQVGHSLGGFLAEFGAAYLASPKPLPGDEDNFYSTKEAQHYFRLHAPREEDANAITFDSLGSVNVLNKLEIAIGLANSQHYFLSPNIANTANGHDGNRYILLSYGSNHCDYQSEGHETSFASHAVHNFNEVLSTVDTHSLEEMIRRFNLDTGEANNKQAVLEWPVAINTFDIGLRILPPIADRSQPSNEAWAAFFRFTAASIVHQVTDGVIAFTHIRTGDLHYENRQNRPQCPVS